jgi:hypothetical protein
VRERSPPVSTTLKRRQLPGVSDRTGQFLDSLFGFFFGVTHASTGTNIVQMTNRGAVCAKYGLDFSVLRPQQMEFACRRLMYDLLAFISK